MWDSWVPPSPNINVGHNLESRTPTDQHWLWGEGFSCFLSLSQILCTWLSEFWLKICYFVESVKNLLLLRGGSNQVWAWPKTIKTTFYDMNHLTPLWPPRSHGGSPSLWNLSLLPIFDFSGQNWHISGVRGKKSFRYHFDTWYCLPFYGKKRRKTEKKRRKTERKLIFRVHLTKYGTGPISAPEKNVHQNLPKCMFYHIMK